MPLSRRVADATGPMDAITARFRPALNSEESPSSDAIFIAWVSCTDAVNITTSTSDNGRWQFYCSIPGHAPGTNESRTGMVGWVQVSAASPPPTPGFEVVLVIAALGVVALATRAFPRRK